MPDVICDTSSLQYLYQLGMLHILPVLAEQVIVPPDELYDLEADLFEMTNLTPDPAYEDVLCEMAARMWRRIRETDDLNLVHSHHGMFRHAPVGHAFA